MKHYITQNSKVKSTNQRTIYYQLYYYYILLVILNQSILSSESLAKPKTADKGLKVKGQRSRNSGRDGQPHMNVFVLAHFSNVSYQWRLKCGNCTPHVWGTEETKTIPHTPSFVQGENKGSGCQRLTFSFSSSPFSSVSPGLSWPSQWCLRCLFREEGRRWRRSGKTRSVWRRGTSSCAGFHSRPRFPVALPWRAKAHDITCAEEFRYTLGDIMSALCITWAPRSL